MMRDRYDATSKDALVALLHDVGIVERSVEAGATSQRIDVFFRPDAQHRKARRARGLLGAISDRRECDFEPFGNLDDVADALRRLRRETCRTADAPQHGRGRVV
jgi:hypothetical protein